MHLGRANLTEADRSRHLAMMSTHKLWPIVVGAVGVGFTGLRAAGPVGGVIGTIGGAIGGLLGERYFRWGSK